MTIHAWYIILVVLLSIFVTSISWNIIYKFKYPLYGKLIATTKIDSDNEEYIDLKFVIEKDLDLEKNNYISIKVENSQNKHTI